MANQFYIKTQDGELYGPFTQAEIKQEIAQGSIILEDYISKSEQGPWITVREAVVQLNHTKKASTRKEAGQQHSHQSSVIQPIHSDQAPDQVEKYPLPETVTPVQQTSVSEDQPEKVSTLFDPDGSNPKIEVHAAIQQPIKTPSIETESAAMAETANGASSDGLRASSASTYVAPISGHSPQKSSALNQALNYLTFFTSIIAILAIGGYYYTHDILNLQKPVVIDRKIEDDSTQDPVQLVTNPMPVDLTLAQANLLHNMIQTCFIGESLVGLVNEISGMQDEKKVALCVEIMRHDFSRLKQWAEENQKTLTADQEVNQEIQALITTRDLAIHVAESLQFGGYIPWMAGNDKYARPTSARAEKVIIVKIYQPKVDDNMKNIPWVEKLLTNKPSEIPDPSQKGIFLYFNALDWAKYIDRKEQDILKRLKDLL